MKKTICDCELSGKKTLIRVDFNVPIKDGVIQDETRIHAALPTIKFAIEKGAKVILLSHLGRVKEEADLAKNSLQPVATKLAQLLQKDIKFVAQTRGQEVEDTIAALNDGDVCMLENTRFEDLDGKKESKNDPELGKYWASLGEVFINDAFGTAHRAHASNVGIASNLGGAYAGFLMEKEVKFIGDTLANPNRPFVAILGGAKVSDKIEVIKNLLKIADHIIIGGGMAYTFMAAKGYKVGKSILEEDKIELAKELIELGKDKLVFGEDILTGQEFDKDTPKAKRSYSSIPENEMGLDIGPKTMKKFIGFIKDAKTIIWNGPLGVFEFPRFAIGTKKIALTIAKKRDAITIIGGGDSASAITQFGLADKFTHVSTGGGASLEYMEGKDLPGVACILDKE